MSDRLARSGLTGWAGRQTRASGTIETVLADPRSYERQIDRLLDRHAMGRGMHELREGEVSLTSVAARHRDVARLIARTVAAGGYEPDPAEIRTIRVGGKRRVVFALGLVDVLVHRVVSDALETAIEPTLSPRLLSYRPGIPWWRGAQELAAWIRGHEGRRDSSGRLRGGLFVLRRDIRSYTDTIPVDDGSAVWAMVEHALSPSEPMAPWAWSVIRSVIRPAVLGPGGRPLVRDRGAPDRPAGLVRPLQPLPAGPRS